MKKLSIFSVLFVCFIIFFLTGCSKKDGVYYKYHENGKVRREATYKNGKLNGPFKTYYNDGQLKMEGYYKDDMREGECKIYSDKGRLEQVEVYKNNKLVR